jgi:hypothetical protein
MQRYAGILIPKFDYWQGVFIPDEIIPLGEAMLRGARQAYPSAPTGQKTISPLSGIPEQDQGLFGALCAIVIDGASKSQEEQIAAAITAVHLMTKDPFFIIKGTPEKEGFTTSYERLNVDSIAKAREAIERLPEVMVMKMKTLKQAKDLATKGRQS